MKWIGLTGGIATGKSAAALIIKNLGYPVIDADQLARQAVEKNSECLSSVVQVFGLDLLLADGNLDRAKLGKIIFSDDKKREKLESIIHPWIKTEVQKKKTNLISQGNIKLAFYDVPLLFEKNMNADFDLVVLVYCPEALQLKRLMQRNSLSLGEAQLRLKSQINIEDKKSKADFVIDNTGSLSELETNVKKTVQLILS